MKLIFCCAVAVSMLAPAISQAQNFELGAEAFKEGDYETAVREWTLLAEQGDINAQKRLSAIYFIGMGVDRDHAESVKWTRLSAEQGDLDSQISLGGAYESGTGVTQDFISAHMWFNIAASNGADSGPNRRIRIAAKMTAASIAEAQARARMCVASGYENCY